MQGPALEYKGGNAVDIDVHFLSDLIMDMDFLEQGLASLGSEMLAHQYLKKRGLR
jgi:hypothetical protein